MKRPPFVRWLLASAAVAAAVALAGCNTDGPAGLSGRSMAPLSPRMISEIAQKNMTKESPILVRLFKEEAELEVWKQDRSGRFALLKTYPICRWSGELGPKVTEGDRQAPEGFYTITPGLLNPNSNYYLAINMGFPNAYDKANGRDGAFLMIHGDCSSRGCYAMTDEQIAEIYALARESFFGGQRAFQIQAYPFRMTPLNMAKHRNSPHMAFWRMLKEGYDHFEVTHLEPKVDVCEKRYVFDAESPDATPLRFNPAGKCPVYRLPQEIASAVQNKQRQDERQVAELVARGTPTVPVRMGTDGGMNPVFLAALRPATESGTGKPITAAIPGTIPPGTTPPGPPAHQSGGFSLASAFSKPAPTTPQRSGANPTVVAVAPNGKSSSNLFGGLFASNGAEHASEPPSTGAVETKTQPGDLRGTQPAAVAETAKAKPAASPAHTTSLAALHSKPATRTAERSNPGAIRPASSEHKSQEANAATMSGAEPTVPSGSFDTRFGPWR